MKSLVHEWVAKVEGDFHTATRERRARLHANPDALCFHAQQCVEKYLKAWLLHHQVAFGRTHDLGELLHLCLTKRPAWELLRPSVLLLNQYAVEVRYPGEGASPAEAREAYSILNRLREEIARTSACRKHKPGMNRDRHLTRLNFAKFSEAGVCPFFFKPGGRQRRRNRRFFPDRIDWVF